MAFANHYSWSMSVYQSDSSPQVLPFMHLLATYSTPIHFKAGLGVGISYQSSTTNAVGLNTNSVSSNLITVVKAICSAYGMNVLTLSNEGSITLIKDIKWSLREKSMDNQRQTKLISLLNKVYYIL